MAIEHQSQNNIADYANSANESMPGTMDMEASQEVNVSDKKEETQFESTVAAAIATRNMLRSRKKSLEDSEKKPKDASLRQPLTAVENTSEKKAESLPDIQNKHADVPDLSTLPEQPYNEEIIDPATIKKANQVDKWAHMIDSMSLIARLRQLAIHATIDDNSTDELLILQLDQSIKHLNSDAAHKQLEQRISEYLQRKVTVELNIVGKNVSQIPIKFNLILTTSVMNMQSKF